MATPFTVTIDSATISTTEYSLPTDSTTRVAQTTVCVLECWIDFAAMTAAETYDVIMYEKVNGGTQRVLFSNRLVGVQAELYRLGPLFVSEGWDVTVTKIAGTDRSIGWSLRKDVGEVNVIQWLGTACASPTVSGVPEVDVTYWTGVAAGAADVYGGVPVHKSSTPVVTAGEVDSATATTLTVATTGAPEVDDACIGMLLVSWYINEGNTDWQCRRISAYDSASRAFTVNADWDNTPTSAWSYRVVADAVADANVVKWLNTAVPTPTVAGVPNVNTKTWNDLTTAALPLTPTVAGRALDVSAGGEAGVDWANVGSPTTTVGLSGTTVKTATDVTALLPAALVGGRIDASVGAVAANAITAAAIAAGAIDLATLAADLLTALYVRQNTATAGGASTITLDGAASATDSFYKNTKIFIASGTGAGQTRGYSSYVGATKVYTVDSAWDVVPDATTVFILFTNVGAAGGTVDANVVSWLGTAASTPTVAGVPNVNVKTWNDLPTVALPLIPTTAGRTLDVSATGEAGVDWANVGSPTTAVGLSGTTIKEVTDVAAALATAQTGITSTLEAVGVIRRNTAQAGAASTITLDAAASASDDFYKNGLIIILSGVGSLQFRTISSYVGATKVVTVDRAWASVPDNTSVFLIVVAGGAGSSGGATAAEVDTQLTSTHGAGSWRADRGVS